VTWSYDKTYQLTNEKRSGSNSYNITYTYDPVGNRLTEVNGGATTTNTYDAADELVKSQATGGVTTYTFDAAGNLLTSRNPSNQRTSYTWDFENRLTQVALPSGVPNTFVYNGDDQRVQKQDSTGTTKHVWDGENILLETDGSNIIQVVYTLEPEEYGDLISQRRSGTSAFYLFDGLGSTWQLANSTGSITDSYLYDSFGNAIVASGSTVNPYRYVGMQGYYYDLDLAKYYVRARTYDATTGRFLSREQKSSDRIIILYIYSNNNPVIFVDESGLQPRRPPKRRPPKRRPPKRRPPKQPPPLPPRLQNDLFIEDKGSDVGQCGAAEFNIDWHVRPERNGWIIQHVTVTLKPRPCSLNEGQCMDIKYWEAWRVLGGIVQGTSPNDKFTLLPAFDYKNFNFNAYKILHFPRGVSLKRPGE
jgi:RHS repeat-associated protein